MQITRRRLMALAASASAGCAPRRPVVPLAPTLPPRFLPRVAVAPERVIRVVTGLRPFRPSGFVVRAEKVGEKLIVHNYGHGGAGITLSWGTSQLAIQEAAQVEARQSAVLGCGVIGLSTARLLQQRGYSVTIYTRDMPPETTSNIAGGLWEPVSVYDHERVTPEFRRQFAEAARFAFRRYQLLTGDLYGVRWLSLYSLSSDGPHQPPPSTSAASEVEPLYPEARVLAQGEHPFPVPYAYRRFSMLIEPSIYLPALLRDFFLAGGHIVVREFHQPAELTALPEPVIFNCTGLGARALFNDQELTPIKGQLVFLLPQPEIQYMTVGPGDIYMFPRRDGILLGGSHQRGEWNLDPDPATTARILRENGILFGGMRWPGAPAP